MVVLLDAKNRIVGVDPISTGTLTASLVHPREVFKAIVLANAAAFICVHNHLSGDPMPSPEDQEITRRLKELAELCGVRLLDHVVIGNGKFISMLDDGYLI